MVGLTLHVLHAHEAGLEGQLGEAQALLVLAEILDPEAPEERAQVGLDRRHAEEELRGDVLVGRRARPRVAAGERARREHDDPLDALAAYIHAVLDLKTSAVIPTLLDELDLEEPQIQATRRKSARLADQLVDAAHAAGALRKDVTFGDVGLMLVRLSRPLPGPIPAEIQDALAHRHADLFLSGLRADSPAPALSGPALELDDLQELRKHP